MCAPFPRGYTVSRGVPDNCAFEITLLQAITLTLFLVCAFSPKVQSIFWGPHNGQCLAMTKSALHGKTQAFASNRRTPTCGWVLCPLKRTRSQYRKDVDGRDVNGAAHGAHCTFEIALSGATMLTLLFVCAFSPRVHSIPRGPPFLKLTTKRHKVSAKIDTLHNASVCKQPPNANLWLGSMPLGTDSFAISKGR